MLVSSILSVLVSPASLKTPGILILLVLLGERNYCQAGFLQITVVMRGAVGGYCFESQLKCYCAIQSGIFPMGLTETQANICRHTDSWVHIAAVTCSLQMWSSLGTEWGGTVGRVRQRGGEGESERSSGISSCFGTITACWRSHSWGGVYFCNFLIAIINDLIILSGWHEYCSFFCVTNTFASCPATLPSVSISWKHQILWGEWHLPKWYHLGCKNKITS